MADYNSSLPVRTESAGDVDVLISDATTPSQKLKVNVDGSIDVNAAVKVGEKIIITDGTEDMAVNADGSINAVVTATDLDIRDLTATSDSVQANLFDEAGVAYSLTNPLPVEMVSDSSGDEVCDYQTTASVASDASVNHDYTVSVGKTLLLEQAWVTGSGKIKVELFVNAVAKFVGFNSTANPNVEIPVKKMCKANAGEIVRLTVTNLDNQAQDLYSTLTGLEV